MPTPHATPAQVEVRPAVSVLLVRDSAQGLEVFVQHRVATMDFAAGMVVYPGGRVDPIDSETASAIPFDSSLLSAHENLWQHSTLAQNWQSAGRPEPSFAGVLLACAQRELHEETGGRVPAQALVPWANWTTPPGPPRRFDTYFYLADGTSVEVRHQTTEATDSQWLSTTEILRRRSAGKARLMRPTLVLLDELHQLGSARAALDIHRIVDPVRPTDEVPPTGVIG